MKRPRGLTQRMNHEGVGRVVKSCREFGELEGVDELVGWSELWQKLNGLKILRRGKRREAW